jgi:hypothetical protein
VLSSADGQTWESAALISGENTDLRDPKICTTPDGRLMLLAAASWHQKDAPVARQPVVYFSNDASHWGKPAEVGEANYWLWRVTWHGPQALGIGYGVGDRPKEVRLYSTRDGLRYDTVVSSLYQEGYPNESALVFADDTCLCLLRRDDPPHTGLIGTAKAPYHQWQWKPLPVRIGGPQMIRLPDGRLLAAVRLYEGGVRTSLCWIDPEQGGLTEAIDLPSAGDTSYAGMVLHDGILWVSYYSSHEGKTSIYLAQVQITN